MKNIPTLISKNTEADDDKFYTDTPKVQQMSLNSNQILYMSDSRATSKQTYVCELCASVFVNNIDLQKHIHEMHNHQMTPSTSMFLSFPTETKFTKTDMKIDIKDEFIM